MSSLLSDAAALRALMESNPDGMVVLDLEYRVVLCNRHYLAMWNMSEQQIREMTPDERWAWHRQQLSASMRAATDPIYRLDPENTGGPTVFQLADGRWLERRVHDYQVDGRKAGVVVNWRDITEVHEANRLALYERELMHELMDSIPDQIFFKDLDSRFIRINPALARRYGIGHPAEAIGKSDADYYSAEHAARTRADELEVIRTGKPLVNQVLLERWPDGSETWNVSTKMPLHDPHGRLVGTYGIAHDITEHKRNEALIWQQANFDALTELPNRRLLRDRWEQARALRERSGLLLALLVLDLDRFKAVNDSLGHARGDELLVLASRRLRECVRASDTVARLGGDEFAVILNGLPDAGVAEELAGKIVDAMARPFMIAGHQVHVSGSVGIALCPRDGDDLDALFLHADGAMYRAKAGGRNRLHLHVPG